MDRRLWESLADTDLGAIGGRDVDLNQIGWSIEHALRDTFDTVPEDLQKQMTELKAALVSAEDRIRRLATDVADRIEE